MTRRTRSAQSNAFACLLEPLALIFLAFGAGAGEFAQAAKVAHVRASSKSLARGKQRVSRSRIAVVTGLTRAEVRKLLEDVPGARHERYRNRAQRVLDGWRTDKNFLDSRGRPIEITLRGKRQPLEELVRRHAGDIPMRAVLDELLQAEAVIRPAKVTLRLASISAKS